MNSPSPQTLYFTFQKRNSQKHKRYIFNMDKWKILPKLYSMIYWLDGSKTDYHLYRKRVKC